MPPPSPLDWDRLRAWRGRHVGRPLRVLEIVDSTNSEALRQLDLGAGATFVAQRQTAGRGTHGREWEHLPGKSLALSVVAEPDPARIPPASITMLGAVSACEALEAMGLATARVRWPNDVYCEGRKIAGVLVEVRARPPLLAAALGIGVNVAQDDQDFDGIYRAPPTSLLLEGHARTVPEVAHALLLALDRWFDELTTAGPEALAAAFCRRLGLLERPVEVVTPGSVIRGRALCLDPDGTVTVRLDAGPEVAVPGGHILRIE